MTEEKETAGCEPAAFEAGENAQSHDPSNPLLAQALRYAERGWAVFPVKAKAKAPLTPHGFKDASTDPTKIEAWWKEYPTANVGIATGSVSGFFVLDIDGEEGEQSLKRLEEAYGPMPTTFEVITGGGGRHLYFRQSTDNPVGSNIKKLGNGLDIRGDGGYVVAPPSIHETGCHYVQSVDSGDSLFAAPPWLILQLREVASTTRRTSPQDWKALIGGTQEGQRNDSLARLAGLLFGSGLHPHIAAELCLCWNEARCVPPMPEDEVLRTISSIAGRELKKKGQDNG